MKLLESLIREVLLTEEVFGAQAFVYHGSSTPPKEMLDILVQNKFDPGHGSGEMYGAGLYTVYEPDPSSPTFQGFYGDWLYKLKINLHGFIIFDPDICQKVYGKSMSPLEQLDMLGMGEVKERAKFHLEMIKNDLILSILDDIEQKEGNVLSSSEADKLSDVLKKFVKGIIFTGRTDGKVCVIYDTAATVPVGWKKTKLTQEYLKAGYTKPQDVPFEPFNRESIKPSISRSAMGDFTPGRFNKDLEV